MGLSFAVALGHRGDIGKINAGNVLAVSLYDDHLALTAPSIKNHAILLNYSQITNADSRPQTGIVEGSYSPIFSVIGVIVLTIGSFVIFSFVSVFPLFLSLLVGIIAAIVEIFD